VSYEEAPRTTDPEGREVVFDAGTREHLINRRPQLLDHIDAILDVVNVPEYHEEDDNRAATSVSTGRISIPGDG
jgi:hypothetical protein